MPRTVACHICGREFGTSSIDIHVPQCERKWEAQQAKKPPKERRPVPQRPEVEPGASRESYNEAALQKWNDEALKMCENCGRTFLPDRLEVHLRSCRPKDGAVVSRHRQQQGGETGGEERVNIAGSPAGRCATPERSRSVPVRPARPQSVVCHICGREFGTASIDIHLRQCEKKWEAAEARKPPRERRPVPQAPAAERGAGGGVEYNEAALEKWNTEALVTCDNCGRTFLPDRLEVHLRSCKPKDGGASQRRQVAPSCQPQAIGGSPGSDGSRKPVAGSFKSPPARPRSVVCHICGREFGTASIDLHLPQCEKKWIATEAQKPPNERRPVPTAPVAEPGMSKEEYNEAALEKWNTEALLACEYCGRTFLPDRLEVHLRSCKPKDLAAFQRRAPAPPQQESASLNHGTGVASKNDIGHLKSPPARPRTVVCHICGREFGTKSIDIHIPQCEQKWKATEAQKAPKDRRPVPKAPVAEPGMSKEEYNEAALDKWNTEALLACENCGRTFLPDRLEVHLRSCRPKDGQARASPPTAAPPPPPPPSAGAVGRGGECVARPRTVVCHICGREFGTASIDIHVPQCEKKWEATEAQKPANERRPVPKAPVVNPGVSKAEYNQAALQQWNDEALLACPNCGRTFLPDRLEVHLRSCKPKDGTSGLEDAAL